MNTPIPPYGVAIQEAINSGDQARMQQVARDAEEYLKNADDVRTALPELYKLLGRQS